MTERERTWYLVLDAKLQVLSCQAGALAHPPREHPHPPGHEERLRVELLHGLRDLASFVGLDRRGHGEG